MRRRRPTVEWMITALVAVSLDASTACAGKPAPTAPGTVAAAIQRWQRDGGSAAIRTLATDFATMGSAGTVTGPGTAAGCRRLLADVQAARSLPAIPDPIAAQDWTTALDRFAQGAGDCATGADTQAPALLLRASVEFDQGTAEVTSTTDRLNQLGGQ